MGYSRTGEWAEYNVTYQDLDVYKLLAKGNGISKNLLTTAEDWALFNKYPLNKFVEQWAFTQLDIKQFKKWHSDTKVEAVLFNEQKDLSGVKYLKKKKIKTFYFGTDPTPLCPTDYENYDHVIWHTECNKETMPCSNGQLIFWGVDTKNVKSLKKTEKCKFFFNAGTDFMNGRKGSDWLVQIWNLVSSNTEADTKLIIHSIFNTDRFQEDNIKKMCDGLCGDRLNLIVGSEGLPGYYHLGNVYLYPARKDGIGLTLLEAMQSGMPIIVPNSKPFNEYVEDGVTGSLINDIEEHGNYPWTPLKSINAAEVASKCLEYIDNPGIISKRSKATIALLKKKFDFDKNHKILLEML